MKIVLAWLFIGQSFALTDWQELLTRKLTERPEQFFTQLNPAPSRQELADLISDSAALMQSQPKSLGVAYMTANAFDGLRVLKYFDAMSLTEAVTVVGLPRLKWYRRLFTGKQELEVIENAQGSARRAALAYLATAAETDHNMKATILPLLLRAASDRSRVVRLVAWHRLFFEPLNPINVTYLRVAFRKLSSLEQRFLLADGRRHRSTWAEAMVDTCHHALGG